jgi:large subunit ribosomal protein L10
MRPGWKPRANCRRASWRHAEARSIFSSIGPWTDATDGPRATACEDRFDYEEVKRTAMPTEAKRQAVAELTEMLRESSAVAVADYRGLSVADMQVVRRSLRESGVELHVTKNRLLKIAADDAGRGELKSMLDGPTALATISGDEATLAKALQDAFRPYTRVVSLRGGLLGNRAIDAAQLAQLASLPNREVLLGKLASGMAAPMTGMAGVLAANLRNLVGVLSAVADQKQQNEGGAAA